MKREQREQAKSKEVERRERRHATKTENAKAGLEVEKSGFKPGAVIKMQGMPKETAYGKQERERSEQEALRRGETVEQFAKGRGLETTPFYKKRIQREREQAWGKRSDMNRHAKETGTSVEEQESAKDREQRVKQQTMKYRYAMERKAAERRGR